VTTDRTCPRPQSTSRHARIRVRNGFTLLEIVVTLVLIGLSAALVAPVFRREAPDDSFAAVLSSARELAVRRAQTMVLRVGADGSWRLTTVDDSASILSGLLAQTPSARQLTITPLGACFDQDAESVEAWDALACAPTGGRRR
jgi:prepilin-type N-terminal cleavage/methylation domain-containing protein